MIGAIRCTNDRLEQMPSFDLFFQLFGSLGSYELRNILVLFLFNVSRASIKLIDNKFVKG